MDANSAALLDLAIKRLNSDREPAFVMSNQPLTVSSSSACHAPIYACAYMPFFQELLSGFF